MTNKAALEVNLRYTHGLTELNNVTAIVGTGSDSRRFRVGGNYTFDIFPDIEKQPGIGIALQALFVRLNTAGSVEFTGIPYIHKALITDQGIVEPFLAIPVGLTLSSGQYQPITTIVVGSMFEHSVHLRSVVEFGLNVNNAQTYLSGGLAYYH